MPCIKRSILGGESNIYNTTIAPNPARGQFQVKLELNVPDDIIIELYDIKGELIDKKTRRDVVFMTEYFQPNQQGLYFIKIRTLKIPSIFTKRVVVLD